MNIKHVLVLALLTATAVGCGDKTTEPGNPPPPPPPPSPAPPPPPPPQPPPPPPPAPPGSGIVSLVTPNADDGALVLTLHGPGISDLATASSGYLFYSRLASDSVARIIVVGDVSAGPIFTFKPSASSQVSAYRVTIDQVASRADAVRASMTNYSLTITAAP